MKTFLLFICFFIVSNGIMAQPFDTIHLNPPDLGSGKLLMQALQERHSSREFSDKELPLQELSNLLWAANGINRPAEGKKTAPTARNKQEIDVYVILKSGIYMYDALKSILVPIVPGDFRAQAGTQDFVATAPVNLIFVSDLDKLGGDKNAQDHYSGMNVGYISQNVYLYCASAGLNTVARGSVDKEKLAATMQLTPSQTIMLGQSVGYKP
jgi:SagB-type dehydrogenase family enzyme